MSASVSETQSPDAGPAAKSRKRRRPLRSTAARSVLAYGEPLVWLTGGALVLSVVMILGLLGLVFSLGLGTFWPLGLVEVKLRDGSILLGEVTKTESFQLDADKLLAEAEPFRQPLLESLVADAGDLGELPGQIEVRIQELETEISSLEQRIGFARERVDRLALDDRKHEATAYDRRDLIIKDQRVDLQKARVDLVALESQRDALRHQLEVARAAFDQFDSANKLDLQTIQTSDDSAKRVALGALLRLVTKRKGKDAIQVRRRMLRTGNYELTSEHFNWVADYKISDGGESYPEPTVTVERVAWGRFFGSPAKFTTQRVREVSTDERQLQELLQFFDRHQSTLSDADAATLAKELESIQELAKRQLAKNVKAFVDETRKQFDGQDVSIQFKTKAGEIKSMDEVGPEDDVLEAVIGWHGTEQAWGQYERRHDTVRERFHHRQHLEKHALGRQYARQERARLGLRQAELDYKLTLVQPAQRLMEIERQLLREQQDLQHAETILDQIRGREGADSELARIGTVIVANLKAVAAESQKGPQRERQSIKDAIVKTPPEVQKRFEESFEVERSASAESAQIQEEIRKLNAENARHQLQMTTADGQQQPLALGDVVRAYQANQLSLTDKVAVYLARWWEFLVDEPREANSEGGVLPAIWGTVTMTLIMSIAVVPFGVLAALYLREYAKTGTIVSAIRIAINNLAGVPSIVFGVFGLGFFCYIIGAHIDGGPRNAGFEPLVPARWYVGLGALAIFSLAAFVIGLIGFTGRHAAKSTLRRVISYVSIGLWIVSLALFGYLVFKTPFFNGFYAANLPNPHWGKGGVVWAALTLALMTLPVVIVATEEALSAVPNSMREGSYGCGASKWQTIRRIVLPQALPGIMTGMILAMARGAGEVAPLMLVGAVKLAPELPLDSTFPFLHGNRSFMHLGFHIFDVGFQSQNSEAAKPMVYTTTLLLILIITVLNLLAVWLRAYLRKRFVAGQF